MTNDQINFSNTRKERRRRMRKTYFQTDRQTPQPAPPFPLLLHNLIIFSRLLNRLLEHNLRQTIDTLLCHRRPLTKRSHNIHALQLPRPHGLHKRRRIVLCRNVQFSGTQDRAVRGDMQDRQRRGCWRRSSRTRLRRREAREKRGEERGRERGGEVPGRRDFGVDFFPLLQGAVLPGWFVVGGCVAGGRGRSYWGCGAVGGRHLVSLLVVLSGSSSIWKTSPLFFGLRSVKCECAWGEEPERFI